MIQKNVKILKRHPLYFQSFFPPQCQFIECRFEKTAWFRREKVFNSSVLLKTLFLI